MKLNIFPYFLRCYQVLEHKDDDGYPMKVFITKTTIFEMLLAYFTSKMDDKLVFDWRLSEKRKLNLTDIIFHYE